MVETKSLWGLLVSFLLLLGNLHTQNKQKTEPEQELGTILLVWWTAARHSKSHLLAHWATADDLWRCCRVIIKSIITASHVNFPGMPSFTCEEEKKGWEKKEKWQMGNFRRWVIILYPRHHHTYTSCTPTSLSFLQRRKDREVQTLRPGNSHISF